MKTIIVLPIPGIENFKPKKILRSSPSLEIPSTPPPPRNKPNAILEIYEAFQDRLTFLNRHMISWNSSIL